MKMSRSNSVSSEESPSSPESILDVSPQPSPCPENPSDSLFEDDSSPYCPENPSVSLFEAPQYCPDYGAAEGAPYSPAYRPDAEGAPYSPAYRPDDKENKMPRCYERRLQRQSSPAPKFAVAAAPSLYPGAPSLYPGAPNHHRGCQEDFAEAVRLGDYNQLNYILSRYADLIQINRLIEDGQTALTLSCLKGNVEAAKVLLSHGANPDLTNRDGFSPFHLACFVGRLDLMKVFLNSNSSR